MEQDLEELETQRLESEKERSVLQAQYDQSSVKQELLQQQKIRLQQEKFVVQVQSIKRLGTPKGNACKKLTNQ